jgi:hypothetical protein
MKFPFLSGPHFLHLCKMSVGLEWSPNLLWLFPRHIVPGTGSRSSRHEEDGVTSEVEIREGEWRLGCGIISLSGCVDATNFSVSWIVLCNPYASSRKKAGVFPYYRLGKRQRLSVLYLLKVTCRSDSKVQDLNYHTRVQDPLTRTHKARRLCLYDFHFSF